MNVEFKDDAVCYADGEQWVVNACADSEKYQLVNLNGDRKYSFYGMHGFSMDFQLNTIKQGDCIASSEIDTEQKYNDAVEVFELFGFKPSRRHRGFSKVNPNGLTVFDGDYCYSLHEKPRKITFNQLMAIGELKRLEIDRDKEPQFGKNEDGSMKLIKSNFSASSNKYEREITDRQGNSAVVDVYDVLKAFEVTCPATQHALKKLLFSGLRGHKDLQTDLLEAKESITRAIELNG